MKKKRIALYLIFLTSFVCTIIGYAKSDMIMFFICGAIAVILVVWLSITDKNFGYEEDD